jgi:hypothetical protein
MAVRVIGMPLGGRSATIVSWTVKLTGDTSQNRPTKCHQGTTLAAKVQAGVTTMPWVPAKARM